MLNYQEIQLNDMLNHQGIQLNDMLNLLRTSNTNIRPKFMTSPWLLFINFELNGENLPPMT